MDDVKAQLQTARERLAAFEEASDRSNLLARLQAASPTHPVLIARAGVAFGGMILAVLGMATLAAPMAGRDIAVQVHDINEAIGFPFPVALLTLAGCGIAMAIALHQLALAVARQVPLLPDEAKKHQRLVADVKQLESRLALEGTPRPAVRVTSR